MAIEQIDCVRGNARKELERLMSLEKQLSLATASLEEQLKLGYRTNRHNILQAKKKVAELKRSVNREKCSNCKKRHHCLNFAFRLQDIRARLERLADASGFNLERKLAFLTELGYIDGDTVLPRGQVARDIFGYEIVATELYFDGFFKDLDVDTIAAVLSGIVFENRNRWTVKPASIYLREILTVARRKVERLLSLELTLLGTNTISPIESCMAQAAHDFSQGADFQDVLSSQTILDEGDLIRLFRNIVDLARQMRRAFREDETTAAKFEEVIRRMCRDVVDASRYL